jgi:hypothetical protein
VGTTISFPESDHGRALDVTLQSAVVKGGAHGWVERVLLLAEWRSPTTSVTRRVRQLHFMGWPDHGVPADPAHFLQFVHAAMAAQHKGATEAKVHALCLFLLCA